MHTVLETDVFARSAKQLGLSEDERYRITSSIAEDPTLGDIMPGTGGARKRRFPKPGTGKSGGYRVVHYHAADDVPVFLLDIYAKGQKIDLTQSERNALRNILGGIADGYRAAAKARVARLPEVAS